MQSTGFFWIALVSVVVAQVAIVAAAARRPRVVHTDNAIPLPHRAAEVAWALMPAVMLALVLLLTWNAIRLGQADRAPVPAPGIVIEPDGARAS